MTIHLPQLIWIVLVSWQLAIYAVRDGDLKKPETYKFGVQLVGTALSMGLLYWGGFFG